ncbi:MAG: deoxynucleoside kinase [Flavobacteriales bacterium]|jgi:deoxyguanosine kinase|nr:deoxynucleoside kinase [Flavobacteriales bacterium]HOZ40532.1 deoxynucleoside kinase [Flavobacteriales bacterium]
MNIPASVPERPFRYDYIAVEGLIGAGKTTLCKRLANERGARQVLEEFEENPFLPRFYAEPERYGFSVELSFLAQRYHQLKRITEQDLFVPRTVADYSLGKSLVFASVTLNADEYALFLDLYRIMYADLPRPELIVYLHLPMERVLQRIAQRGRSYESAIQTDYLEQLQERYLDHLQKTSGSRVLVVDIGLHDLLQDKRSYQAILDLIDEPMEPGYRSVVL